MPEGEPNKSSAHRQVWKYPLNLAARPQTVLLPAAAKAVLVAEQAGRLLLWVEVDPETPSSPRTYTVVGTNETLPVGSEYVGSAFFGGQDFHVYEGGAQ